MRFKSLPAPRSSKACLEEVLVMLGDQPVGGIVGVLGEGAVVAGPRTDVTRKVVGVGEPAASESVFEMGRFFRS